MNTIRMTSPNLQSTIRLTSPISFGSPFFVLRLEELVATTKTGGLFTPGANVIKLLSEAIFQ